MEELVKRLIEVEEMLKVAQFKEAANLIEQAADAIEKLLQKTQRFPRWIPVTERLPREGRYLALTTPFLKCDEPYARILRFAESLELVDEYDFRGLNRSGWYFYDDEYGHIEVDTVTHWMPLPEPPKGEDE